MQRFYLPAYIPLNKRKLPRFSYETAALLSSVPPGTTSQIQPLDVAINTLFKTYVREQFEQHLNENIQLHLENKLTARDRRVLTTKCVVNAWTKIKQNKDLIIRSEVRNIEQSRRIGRPCCLYSEIRRLQVCRNRKENST